MFCFPGRSLLAHSAAEQLGYLAKVMEKSAQPFVSVDADGSIIICNRQFANLTGFDQEELSCKKWERDFVPAQSISKSDINWGDIRATGQPRRYETEYNCKNGSTLSVEVTLHKVEEQPDERPCYFALVTDITARKNTENKLLQANRDLEIMKTELLAATQQMMASEEELRYQLEELKISRQALFDSESKYRNILDSIEDGYYEVDVHGNISFVNRYIIQFTGLSLDELLGMNYKRAFDRRNAKKLRSAFHRVYLSGQPVRDLVWFVVTRKDKQKMYVESTVLPIKKDGSIVGFRGIIRDVTEKILAQDALQKSEACYRAVVEDQTELVCRFLPNGTLSFVNEAYCRAFNQRRDELIGSAFLPYINQEDRQTLKMCLASLSPQNPVATSELRIDTAVGVRWLQWTHHAIYDELGHMVNFQSVGRDITEKKEAEEKLRYLSMHDSLTGLYNRFYFEEEMKRLESSRHNPVAIIMWDVDGLKLINDTMGHDKGDELLVAASRIIKACFREGDAVARVGGDEFAVILPHTSRVIIENALARISNVIKDYNEEHPGLPLSISTGFAVRSEGDQSINEIFKEADNKMYREKLHSQQSNRSVLVHALMKALRERDFITEGHGDRLQQIVYDMAETLNLQNSSLNDLRLLAQFHDIGKVGVPDAILFKPGPLDMQEYNEMKRHSEIGHRIALSAPDLVPIAEWILKHHEWWNGQGYPLGLRGEEIPLECRILAIADAYDAMTNDRPYRKALPKDIALEEIKKHAGVQFDPYLVEKFTVLWGKPN